MTQLGQLISRKPLHIGRIMYLIQNIQSSNLVVIIHRNVYTYT